MRRVAWLVMGVGCIVVAAGCGALDGAPTNERRGILGAADANPGVPEGVLLVEIPVPPTLTPKGDSTVTGALLTLLPEGMSCGIRHDREEPLQSDIQRQGQSHIEAVSREPRERGDSRGAAPSLWAHLDEAGVGILN